MINDEIQADKVRLVGPTGNQLGIVPIQEAREQAENFKMDLVLMADQAAPPVCKILDFGKHQFEQKKQKQSANKKQRQIQVKEIKVRPGTDEGDYQVKLRNLIRFLECGDKAKVTLRFRGRELAHQDLGVALLRRVEEDLSDYGQVEQFPQSLEGRQMIMLVAPLSKQIADKRRREKEKEKALVEQEQQATTAT